MARVLEPLRPLVSLFLQAPAPAETAAAATNIAAAAGTGPEIAALIQDAVVDRRLVSYALVHAGVVDEVGEVTQAAPLLLAQAHAMVAMSLEEGWELVLTVPAFLTESLNEMSRDNGGPGLPLDTGRTIRHVAESAQSHLVIAALYLHPSFAATVAPALSTLTEAGGTGTVITRALGRSAPDRSNANVAAVEVLRGAAGGGLRVCSWDESGLGIHFKVVLADDQLAYIGSANLTPGGTRSHAEAGMLLRGSRVKALSRWLHVVADELARRS
ncbi:phospholipase D-like domain-containing protein [Streptomyces yangpuensis]|uniref:phospholipase D-like domain-containing protein n=1 Tax=Streptomyces yangpuensis TaxID=1648182 RepID=UPI0006295E1B|nr:phospholipase D-like domain-containing protein [Streptomyces yangpuensis]